jgi:hypothetical protein
MGVEFIPQLVYGVQEPSEDKSVDVEFLWELKLDHYATSVGGMHMARGLLYGIAVKDFETAQSGSFEGKDIVDKFAEDYGFEAPGFHMGISGDFEVGHWCEQYTPDTKQQPTVEAQLKRRKVESSEDADAQENQEEESPIKASDD